MNYQAIKSREYYEKYTLSKQHPCLDCGKLVYPTALRCRSCAAKARTDKRDVSPKPTKHCPDCNKPINRRSTRCKRCTSKLRWRSGRVWQDKGYILIYKPEHPASRGDGSIYEHRFVWEQANNKMLPKGWVIHHLNGIRHDNRPSNLVALPTAKHNGILAAKAKRIQELEAMLRNQGQLI